MKVKVYIGTDNQLLDLFDDESISIVNKLQDIDKLSNIFTDFSDTFSVPANDRNNKIFKHYYNIDKYGDNFNANIKVDAYIEVNSIPYRWGKVQLDSVIMKDHRPDSYKISFFGGLTQLSDLFGEDTIDLLDYDIDKVTSEKTKVRSNLSQFDYTYTERKVLDTINEPSALSGDVITPLISYTNRDWNFGDGTTLDISTTGGAILDSELRPALRIIRILEAIEDKYNITFSRDFFGKAVFNNLFMWLNKKEGSASSKEFSVSVTNPFTGDTLDERYNQMRATFSSPDSFNIYAPDKSVSKRFTKEWSLTVRPDVSTIKYDVIVYDENDNEVKKFTKNSGTKSFTVAKSSKKDVLKFGSTTRKFKVITEQDMTGSVDMNMRVYSGFFNVNSYINVNSSGNTFFYDAGVNINENMQDMKVSDFITGLFKLFKLVIRPVTGSDFYVNTLDGFYGDGNILQVSQFTDFKEVEIKRPEIYKNIQFNFQKTDNVLGKKYRDLNVSNKSIGYGDLMASYPTVESSADLKVEVPFENMMFERLYNLSNNTPTLITIGQAISTSDYVSFAPNKCKPILFFNNGIIGDINQQIKFKFGDGAVQNIDHWYNIGNTNDALLEQVTDTINFGSENDQWHQTRVDNSLYLNYWENWIETIYHPTQRKLKYQTVLPMRYVNELSLNDRIVIGNNRYKINDFKVNLNDLTAELNLFKDIYEWNGYSYPRNLNFQSKVFTPNAINIYDWVDLTTSGYIYGNFNTYDGQTRNGLVKLKLDGTIDTSFPAGTGFSSNSNYFNSITRVSGDSSIIATGDFTSYNGSARNYLAKIYDTGVLDTNFGAGTGFNARTTESALDSNGNVYVCGNFTSYSGVGYNRIIKLDGNSNIVSGFNIGTGFNGLTTSVVVSDNNSIYVSGLFSTYSGVSKNRIVKLTSGGTIDSSFNIGTGFNSNNTTELVGLLDDGAGGVYVYGYFTKYSGNTTANRFTRLNPNGEIDESMIGTGFSAYIETAKKVLGDKILVQGGFTNYKGYPEATNNVILNADASIYMTLPTDYTRYYVLDSAVYGVTPIDDTTKLISDEKFPILSTNFIAANAGMKYYKIDILKDCNWSVSKTDLGWGTSWVTLNPLNTGTTSGTKATEFVIRVEERISQSLIPRALDRYMDLKFVIDGVIREVRILQEGIFIA